MAFAQDTPVAAYSFDAGEGSVAEDLSGEHDGTIEGPTWFDNGKYGKALSFDGENDCVTVPDAEDLRITEELTVQAWVRPSSVSDQPIIYKESYGHKGHQLAIGLYETGKPEAFLAEGYEGEYDTVEGSESLEANVWVHLAFTYDGGKMRLYVNGVLVDDKGHSEGAPWAEGDLVFGCNPNYPPERFEGLIDEVRIYNRALSEGEIAADLGGGLQTPSRTPVAAYSFDAGEGEVAEDLFGEHDGTIAGATWFDKGKYGSALSFDGENDCVTIADAADLNLSEDFTLEAWVRPKGSGTDEPILFKETPSFGAYTLYYGLEQSGHMEGLMGEGLSFRRTVNGATQEKNIWTHVALTYDRNRMRLYVNGHLDDTTYAPSPAAPQSGGGPLSIGCSQAFADNFKGLIDEVRIYNRALSEGEIAADLGGGLQTPSRAPVAAYSFDAGEGSTAEDVTGNEHDGTIAGATWFEKGKYGSALSFDGENDCVTIADTADLNLSEDFTLEAWVRPKGSGTDEPILFKETPSFGAYTLYYGLEESGHMEGLLGEGLSFRRTVNGATQEKNIWTHVALTYDRNRMRLYVNGQLDDTTYAPEAAAPQSGGGPLSIGCSQAFADNFKGLIDEVRIYNRALSEGEIAADLGGGLQTPSRAPVAAYSFDAGEGSTAEDVTGNEHDGTIAGATWFDKGKYGSALSFDGEEGEEVVIADADDLDFTEEFTLEAWVKPRKTVEWSQVVTKQRGLGISYQLSAHSNHNAPAGYIQGTEKEWGVDGGTTPLPTNVWSHVAYTSDGGKLRFFVNGELKGTASGFEAVTGTGPLLIGGGEEGYVFEGLIDEVRLYNRALGIDEVVADGAVGLQAPSRTPVAAYSFDAGEGSVAEDLSGEHDGTIEGPTWFDNGKYGKALSFDGENDCVTVPDAEDLRITEELTVQAWVRPSSVSDQPIIYKESYGHKGHQLAIGLYETGKPEAFLAEGYEGEYDTVEGSESLEANVWVHLAFTYDGGKMRLYVNGALVDDKGHSEGAPWAEGDLVFGCNPNYPPERFEGLIDEVRIYNRALSEGEIADNLAPRYMIKPRMTALYPSGATAPYILLPTAVDPLSLNGSPGSGVTFYLYRYSLNGGSRTPWIRADNAYFQIPEGTAEQIVHVEAYVFDRAHNGAGMIRETLALPAEQKGDLEPEEAQDKEEEEKQEEFIGTFEKTIAIEEPEEEFQALGAGSAILCEEHFGWPHPSSHKSTRTNTKTHVKCEGGPLSGHVRAVLFEDGQIVRDSGLRTFFWLVGGKNEKSAYANVPCVKGAKWQSYNEVFQQYPSSYTPKSHAFQKLSPIRTFPCGRNPKDEK